jgi:hypothetical protein
MASCMVVRPFGMRTFRPRCRRPGSLHLTAYVPCTHSRSSMSPSGIQCSFHRILNKCLAIGLADVSGRIYLRPQSTVAFRLLFGKGCLGMRRRPHSNSVLPGTGLDFFGSRLFVNLAYLDKGAHAQPRSRLEIYVHGGATVVGMQLPPDPGTGWPASSQTMRPPRRL